MTRTRTHTRNAPRRRRAIVLGPLVIVAVILTLVLINHRDSRNESLSPNPSAPHSSTTGATMNPTEPPTTDLFGNRLEVPADPAGQPLPQDPATRIEPTRLDYLTAAPARLRWQRGWGGAALPISGSDGPTRIDGGVASGFAHTPQGAALAACDAIARAFAAPEELWQDIVRQRYLGGGQPLLDRIDRSRRSSPETPRYLTVPEGIRIQPGYQPDFAVVQIAVRAPGGWAYGSWPMAWSDGDWRVRVPDDLEILWEPAVPVANLIEFGVWKAAG